MQSSSRWLRLIVFAGVLFTAAVLIDLWPAIRGPEAWRWQLLATPPAARLIFSGLATLLFVVGWWLLGRWLAERPSRSRSGVALAILLFLILLVQTALLGLTPATSGAYNPVAVQFERLASNQASGYFTVAQDINHLPTFLSRFPELMPTFTPDPHPRSKPPGIVLLYWGMERLLQQVPGLSAPLGQWARSFRCHDLWLAGRPDAALAANLLLGLLIPLLSALAILPAFALARRWRGIWAGWLAAGLVAFLPGRLIFTPHMDTVYPLFTLLALWLVDQGLIRRSPFWSALAGLVISVATFLSLVNGLIAALAGLFVVARQLTPLRDRRERRQAIEVVLLHGVALTVGVFSLWLLYWLASGVSMWAIYQAATPARHDLARSYWLWLGGNVYDFAIFAGLPAFLLALPLWWRRREPAVANLAAAFWSVFAVLVVSGMIRGEVGRIWLMLAPVPAVLAACHLLSLTGTQERSRRLLAALAVLGVTALSGWAMGTRWEVTSLEWPYQEPRSVVWAAPPVGQPVELTFGPSVRLHGYDLQQTGDELELTFYWRAERQLPRAYTVFIHLVNSQGEIVRQQDIMPDEGRLPTTCWQPLEYVRDRHQLPVESVPPGSYTLYVGLYQQASGERLGEREFLTGVEIP